MFQTEPIIWLQSLASPALTWFLTGVTTLGYTPVYVALILALAFGARLRPTLVVLVALLLSGTLTETLKSGLAFPRPSSIDVRVGEPGDASPPKAVVERGGAADFWSLPTPEARAAFRARQPDSFGFPSGHVSTATAFLVALALVFRSRRTLAFAVIWVPTMALSRMYLGRHFLADVLGGVAVGLFGALAALVLLHPLERGRAPRPRATGLVPLAVVTGALVILLPFLHALDAENIGRLVGVVATYGVLVGIGFPADAGSVWQRGGRVAIAVVSFVGVTLLLSVLFDVMGWDDTRARILVGRALGTALALALAIAVSRWTRLYGDRAPPPRAVTP